ncbi:hypothetical protein [Paenibacillus sp. A3]|uniref:hypothetical protein n=1 Tax=Paenibacillus sp. A3 TaxID=1337054 RepID=UPI0012F82C1A|nr:hypothetical protein [Paenibacillus sp. A3]
MADQPTGGSLEFTNSKKVDFSILRNIDLFRTKASKVPEAAPDIIDILFRRQRVN